MNLYQLKTKNCKLETSYGFTLIELVIALGVMVLLISVIWTGLEKTRKNQALSTGVETVLSALREARTKTLSLEGNQSYGVYLEEDRVVIFPGESFSEPNILNQEFWLEKAISISTTSLAVSTSTILFNAVTGEVPNYGTITISLKSDASTNRTINVSRTGETSQQ